MIWNSTQPLLLPFQPFVDMARANGVLQRCHIIRQHQQHGVGAVEGEVEDCCVNGLVIININILFHIHHLDWNLEMWQFIGKQAELGAVVYNYCNSSLFSISCLNLNVPRMEMVVCGVLRIERSLPLSCFVYEQKKITRYRWHIKLKPWNKRETSQISSQLTSYL